MEIFLEKRLDGVERRLRKVKQKEIDVVDRRLVARESK
jgi:hypothetical protein